MNLISICNDIINAINISMKFHKLNKDNFLLYATKNYDNPQAMGVDEFNDDIKILSYIKRLLRRYSNTGELKERLLLNHIITLQNVFGNTATARMLFFYCDNKNHSQLKTFLTYLSILPDIIPEVNLTEIKYDKKIIDVLRSI